MEAILGKLNARFSHTGRSILLYGFSKITSYKEAIWRMSKIFLKGMGMYIATSFTYIGPAVDAITSIEVRSMRQRSIYLRTPI